MPNEVKFIPSYRLNLAYSFLRNQGIDLNKNKITDKIDLLNNKYSGFIEKQNINFHHTKLARRMLIAKADNLEMTCSLNETDLFEAGLCNYIIPFIKDYEKITSFEEFYNLEIKPLELKRIDEKKLFVEEGINLCERIWEINPPKKLIVVNNALRSGGHLDIIGKNEKIFLSLDLFAPRDNMIRYVAMHEYSHYFQNKIFEKLEGEIKKKEYLFSRKDKDYGEWKSWLAENVIEAIIFTLIKPPSSKRYSNTLALLKRKYDFAESMVRYIENNKLKKIGLVEMRGIINAL